MQVPQHARPVTEQVAQPVGGDGGGAVVGDGGGGGLPVLLPQDPLLGFPFHTQVTSLLH